MTKPKEFLIEKGLQQMLDLYYDLFGIRIAFCAPTGHELRVGLGRGSCQFCSLLRNELGLEHACRQSDETMRAESIRTRKLVKYTCHAGLNEAVLPVYRENSLLGFFMIGQFRGNKAISKKYKALWRTRSKNNKLEKAWDAVPRLSAKDAKNALLLFELFVRLAMSDTMILIREQQLLQPVLDYFSIHPDKMLSLPQAADLAGRSTSTISHLFTKTFGKRFKQVQIEKKLSHADELMRTHPGITVQEVARQLGYSDPFYFSRLYKKYRGMAPSEALEKSSKSNNV